MVAAAVKRHQSCYKVTVEGGEQCIPTPSWKRAQWIMGRQMISLVISICSKQMCHIVLQ